MPPEDLIAKLESQLPAGATGILVTVVVVVVVAFLANLVTKKVIVRALHAVVSRSGAKWDDVVVEHKVFEKLSHLAPALVLYLAAPTLLEGGESAEYIGLLRRLCNVWMIVAGARATMAGLDAAVTLGRSHPGWRNRPLRSYAQVAVILLWLAVGIVSVATLMEKSPWGLLTGLGAMTAVLLLVFRDSILGFVASVQLAGNDLLRAGDWVEIPKYGADGDVLEIGLHSVKVQNWDKTISSVPTASLLQDGFKNWRGMTDSGGRRIKRSLALDMSSVRFLSTEDLERLGRVELLRDYLVEKGQELEAWSSEHQVDPASPINGRRLTNLGTFRAYIDCYLRSLGDIRQDMTFLVRHLAPGPEGIPIELYVFSGEQRWAEYEGIIADIFDHLLAALPEFGLRPYQRPTGADLGRLGAPSA